MPARKKTRKAATKKTKTRRRARSTARKSAGMARNPRKTPAKAMSKKVGRWRIEAKGRSVYAAGAKHAYSSPEMARVVYKKLTSIKSVEAFVKRYGTKKTQAAVLGLTKTKTPAKKVTKKRAPAKKRRTRRNAPITKAEQQAIDSVLRRHGYRVR